jgi:hypothetical protein
MTSNLGEGVDARDWNLHIPSSELFHYTRKWIMYACQTLGVLRQERFIMEAHLFVIEFMGGR